MKSRCLRLLLLTGSPKVLNATLDLLAAVEGERIRCAWARTVDEIGPAREDERCDVCLIDVQLVLTEPGVVDVLRRRGIPVMVVCPPGGSARRRLRGLPCLEWTAAPDTARDLLHRAAERRRRPRAAAPSPARRFPHPELRDALTGLPNGVLVEQLLAHALTERGGLGAPCVGLILLRVEQADQDGPATDELLQLAARRLQAAVREGDDLGRTGPAELAAVLSGLGSERELATVATRLETALRRPVPRSSAARPMKLRLAWRLLKGSSAAPETALAGLRAELSGAGTPAPPQSESGRALPPLPGPQAGS